MRTRRSAWVVAAIVLLLASPAIAATLPIPAPAKPVLLPGIGATADRLRVSVLPSGATADDSELAMVALAGDGSVQRVTVDQQIRLRGQGDYVVVERGPERRAEVLGSGDPPTLKAGAVLYAGFLPPTGRLLAARLTLDPAYEAARLPLGVRLSFHPRGAATGRPLGPGGRVDGPGYLEVTLTDNSSTVATVSHADAPAAAIAGPLDALRHAAVEPGARPPVAGLGLPTEIAASGAVGQSVTNVPAPLVISGSVTEVDSQGRPVRGATVSGAGTTNTGAVAGVLADATTLRLRVPRAGVVHIALAAAPALDPRSVAPPEGLASWAAWAATRPEETARRAAVDQLEFAAAEAAQIRTVSPYLTTGLPGVVHTRFTFRLDAASATPARPSARLVRRPLAIAVICVAALLIAVNLELLRRRL